MTQTLEEKRRAKTLRAQARRKTRPHTEIQRELYKPLEDWDDEELARGRPRAHDGTFRGSQAAWVSRQVHEEAIRRFTNIVQSDMRAIIPEALATVERILTDQSKDKRGRPIVAPSVKLQAATWIIEHLVGKPTQRVEADISVKLQGILAECLVVPGDGNRPAIDVQSYEAEDSSD